MESDQKKNQWILVGLRAKKNPKAAAFLFFAGEKIYKRNILLKFKPCKSQIDKKSNQHKTNVKYSMQGRKVNRNPLLCLLFFFLSEAALLLSKDQAVQNDLVYKNRSGRPTQSHTRCWTVHPSSETGTDVVSTDDAESYHAVDFDSGFPNPERQHEELIANALVTQRLLNMICVNTSHSSDEWT